MTGWQYAQPINVAIVIHGIPTSDCSSEQARI